MSWFGNLFGTAKAVDDIVDKDNGLIVRAGTALGNLHYSDQEKAEGDERTREWGIRFLDALHPFKIVQRIIAFSTLFIWSFLAVNIIIAYWVEAYTGVDAVTGLFAFATTDYIFYPVLAVLTLYTGGGTINSLRGKE